MQYKKALISLCLILGTTLSNQYAMSADHYNIGVNAFRNGDFKKAETSFYQTIKANPKNVNARYYLAQCYVKQNKVSDAIEQYKRIIILAPDSEAAILSQKGIHIIKTTKTAGTASSTYSSDGDNYLAYALPDSDKIYKWASFPINVYIEPAKQKSAVEKAFQEWQSQSSGTVRFNFVTLKDKAQIIAGFTDSTSEAQDGLYQAGLSKPYYQGEYISKSEIILLTKNPQTREEISDDAVFSTALHEIGHSLGIKGHSPNKNDIMHETGAEEKNTLSARDTNTIKILYKTNPQNLMAKYKNSNTLKLQQALQYTKDHPQNASGWASLGDVYKNKKMYADAIKSYKKASSIEPQKADYYNLLGIAYQESGNIQNALINLKTACDVDKSNSFYIYQFSKLSYETGQKEIGKKYLDAFLKANPQSLTDEKIRYLLQLYK